jgi:hypothetical protein
MSAPWLGTLLLALSLRYQALLRRLAQLSEGVVDVQAWCSWYRSAVFLDSSLSPSCGLPRSLDSVARLWLASSIATLVRSFFIDHTARADQIPLAVSIVRSALGVFQHQLPKVRASLRAKTEGEDEDNDCVGEVEEGYGEAEEEERLGGAAGTSCVRFPNSLPMQLWDAFLTAVPAPQRAGSTFSLAQAFVRTCLARAFETIRERLVAFIAPMRLRRALRPSDSQEEVWALIRVALVDLLGVLRSRCAPIVNPGESTFEWMVMWAGERPRWLGPLLLALQPVTAHGCILSGDLLVVWLMFGCRGCCSWGWGWGWRGHWCPPPDSRRLQGYPGRRRPSALDG